MIMTVGQVEKLAVTQEELEKYYSDIAAQYNMEVAKVKEVFAKNSDRIAQNLYQNKVERFLTDSNVKVSNKKTEDKPKAKKTTTKKVAEKVEKKEEENK